MIKRPMTTLITLGALAVTAGNIAIASEGTAWWIVALAFGIAYGMVLENWRVFKGSIDYGPGYLLEMGYNGGISVVHDGVRIGWAATTDQAAQIINKHQAGNAAN